MLLRTNANSVVVLQSTPQIERPPLFKRFFCGLQGLKRGFLNGCSPFLFFDGCHLRGRYGGVLLSAVTTDANCGLFPVAWAIVESECKESWGFFLTCLEEFIGPFEAEKHWHFMADRQKVIHVYYTFMSFHFTLHCLSILTICCVLTGISAYD